MIKGELNFGKRIKSVDLPPYDPVPFPAKGCFSRTFKPDYTAL
jgi:hypothetical protein